MLTPEEIVDPETDLYTPKFWKPGDPPVVNYLVMSPERPNDLSVHSSEIFARNRVRKQKWGRVFKATFYPPNKQESLRIEMLPR